MKRQKNKKTKEQKGKQTNMLSELLKLRAIIIVSNTQMSTRISRFIVRCSGTS